MIGQQKLQPRSNIIYVVSGATPTQHVMVPQNIFFRKGKGQRQNGSKDRITQKDREKKPPIICLLQVALEIKGTHLSHRLPETLSRLQVRS